MHSHPSIEHAKTYLDAHLSQRVPEVAPMNALDGPFVTLSREAGSGGSTFARLLAERLNLTATGAPPWTVFEEDLVEKMLREHNLPADLARYLPEDRLPEIETLVREIVGLHPNLWTLVQRTNQFTRQIAKRGRAIVVGRGARFATTDIANGLHLRLIGSVDHRASLMAQRLQLPLREAADHNRALDTARRDHVRSVFDADVADPAAYDLILNTDRLSHEVLVELVTPFLQARATRLANARDYT